MATTANKKSQLKFSQGTNVIHQAPTKSQATNASKAWLHFVAGGVGGMAGAIVTSPLDVVRTRLQSSIYGSKTQSIQPFVRSYIPILGHFIDTGKLLTYMYRTEGWRALFKGLGPNLIGVIPARAINFFTYGNGKRILINWNGGQETAYVHLTAAVIAGLVTSTATNPIWLVKTRMQLQTSSVSSALPIKYKNSFDCLKKVVKEEGITGLYKGLSASYLGITEGTIQWVAYEYLKSKLSERRERRRSMSDEAEKPYWHMIDNFFAAGSSKFFAACISYPHEVVRTRLRQLPSEGAKYKGLVHCVKTIFKEEGFSAFYGGMTAHVMRVVPNAAIMFFCYELILQYGGVNNNSSS
ncbi:9754_t:CDS:2 [Acaulospora morrowiae]|uniref:9754_t:CDS:1 n=1 Tax=Acaulospora morrowiae TaxID=94023 RepID=A0A9N9BHW9_9GLOM|nr:9754_t:CDS:2 [Acaulospora morrowiae]